MIEANELRSGNYVQGSPLSIPRMQVHSDGITKVTAPGIALLESDAPINWEPLQLTPEILEKCGFVKTWYEDVIQYELVISKTIDAYNGDKNGFLEAVIEVGGTEAVRCKYVHQLQNVYFILTGKELEITF